MFYDVCNMLFSLKYVSYNCRDFKHLDVCKYLIEEIFCQKRTDWKLDMVGIL